MNSKKLNLIFVVNPVSGKGGALKLLQKIKKKCPKQLESLFQKTNTLSKINAAKVFYTTADSSWLESFKNALSSPSLVVSIGGDGTHSMVAKQLFLLGKSKLDYPLIFLPGGRGNDFLRGLSGKKKKWEYIEFDLGRMIDFQHPETSYLFLNMASLGYGGNIVEKVQTQKKIWTKSRLVYQIEGAFELFSGKSMKATLRRSNEGLNEDPPFELDFYGGFVGNGSCNGSGLFWTPQASVTDGLLDVIFFSKPKALEMAVSISRVKRKKDPSFLFERFLEKSIHLSFSSATGVELDGDFIGKFKDIGFECVPRCLGAWFLR